MTIPYDYEDWDEQDRRDEEINRGWEYGPLIDEAHFPTVEELYGRQP